MVGFLCVRSSFRNIFTGKLGDVYLLYVMDVLICQLTVCHIICGNKQTPSIADTVENKKHQ